MLAILYYLVGRASYYPWPKFFPTEKVKVSGVFPFDKNIGLSLNVSFYTNNPVCKVTEKIFFFIPVQDVDREKEITINVENKGNNRYEAEFFTDEISPGFCGWRYGGMAYSILRGEIYPDRIKDTGSDAIGGIPERRNKIILNCKFLGNINFENKNKNYSKFVSCQKLNNQVFFEKSFPPKTAQIDFFWVER